jgi:hypothetical protein
MTFTAKSAAAKELLRLDHANGAKELEAFYTAQVRDENPFARPKKARTVKVKAKGVKISKATAEADDPTHTQASGQDPCRVQ